MKLMFRSRIWISGLTVWMVVIFSGGSPVLADQKSLWTEKSERGAQSRDGLGLSLFSDLAEKLSPAVVNIRVLERVPVQPFGDYPWGQPGSPVPPGNQFRQKGMGSGFLIHKDGYILTNAHVIDESDELQVGLANGLLFRGQVVGIDKVTDIGLVKIQSPQPLPVLPLGSSEKLKIGEWVMAIGSPFGLEQTVTVGIVSAKGRSMGASPFDDFIQIDASINPGNSGGPLINTRGEVVGINTMILAQGQGLGFSLPIDLVKRILPQLREKGKVERSWMGVVIQEITIDIQEKLGLKGAQGAYIVQVVQDSPAAKAGVQEGDVILEFNNQKLRSSRELPLMCAHAPAGKPLPVVLIRKGKKITISIVLQKAPSRS
ncbi:MAG: trypsin-like serine protease [Nitrospinaceae bacterium]|nr:trypsin-like serine protease [Nitrospinaceae bacterium]NIR56388.1 trypsin-like serine protease [Nitrospinaceae bacterium]NIS86852.1 trypsin-like serine protease [Nitrospinaceae bacterium]NIT83688.1 trypsin-like serine protease [Nitrospinaceae bacterium]NIU45884.1 trypsin-like serine protease [Nitrospinaceae bacterium]